MEVLGCKIIRKGLSNNNNIAITFDDGPHPKYTPMILDLLEKKGVPGTFFNSGFNISHNKELTKEVVERGHLLGNHSFNHRNALFTRRKKLKDEVLRTKELIEDITGKTNRYFRPPYGIISLSLIDICKNLNLSLVLWNLNTRDYQRKSYKKIIERILKKEIKPGSILLFHECNFKNDTLDYANTVKALEIILDITISKGLKLVTIQDMIEDNS